MADTSDTTRSPMSESKAALAIKIGVGELEQVGWLGPYGLIPGGMDVDPAPQWEPVFRVVAAPESED